MLSKLLKYDLKYMIKNMSVFYILAIFFACLTRFMFSLEQSVMVSIIANISAGCMISMLASILMNTILRSWIRFKDSIYKDEGYLTNTLPVTKNDIYNSKFIQTLILFIIGFIVILFGLFIAYYTKDRWFVLKNFIDGITTGFEMSTTVFIISFVSIIFLEVFNAILCGFFGIIVGNRMNDNKLGFSFLFGFIAYMVAQSVVLLIVFIVGLFNSSIMSLFKNTVLLDTGALKTLTYLSIGIYLMIIFVISMISKKVLNKGINIE